MNDVLFERWFEVEGVALALIERGELVGDDIREATKTYEAMAR